MVTIDGVLAGIGVVLLVTTPFLCYWGVVWFVRRVKAWAYNRNGFAARRSIGLAALAATVVFPLVYVAAWMQACVESARSGGMEGYVEIIGRELEEYKKKQGHYPESLAQVREFRHKIRIFGSENERKSNNDGASVVKKRCSEDLLR